MNSYFKIKIMKGDLDMEFPSIHYEDLAGASFDADAFKKNFHTEEYTILVEEMLGNIVIREIEI